MKRNGPSQHAGLYCHVNGTGFASNVIPGIELVQLSQLQCHGSEAKTIKVYKYVNMGGHLTRSQVMTFSAPVLFIPQSSQIRNLNDDQ